MGSFRLSNYLVVDKIFFRMRRDFNPSLFFYEPIINLWFFYNIIEIVVMQLYICVDVCI